jgi:hypothetical protein
MGTDRVCKRSGRAESASGVNLAPRPPSPLRGTCRPTRTPSRRTSHRPAVPVWGLRRKSPTSPTTTRCHGPLNGSRRVPAPSAGPTGPRPAPAALGPLCGRRPNCVADVLGALLSPATLRPRRQSTQILTHPTFTASGPQTTRRSPLCTLSTPTVYPGGGKTPRFVPRVRIDTPDRLLYFVRSLRTRLLPPEAPPIVRPFSPATTDGPLRTCHPRSLPGINRLHCCLQARNPYPRARAGNAWPAKAQI